MRMPRASRNELHDVACARVQVDANDDVDANLCGAPDIGPRANLRASAEDGRPLNRGTWVFGIPGAGRYCG